MKLPKINYKEFSKTRDTIQHYSQLLGIVKSKYLPSQKNADEHSLSLYAKGFTTGTIPLETKDGTKTLDLNINLEEHKLDIVHDNVTDAIELDSQSISSFTKSFLKIINAIGLNDFEIADKFYSEEKLTYDKDEVKKIWNILRQIHFLFFELRGGTLFETSNVNFWPHHFDMALLIFSGNIIEGQDPQNWSYSREQMNFGFSTGDEGIQQPYFYITAYPFDEKKFNLKLPNFARWQKEGWNGIVIEYDQLLNFNATKNDLLSLFNHLLKSNFQNK